MTVHLVTIPADLVAVLCGPDTGPTFDTDTAIDLVTAMASPESAESASAAPGDAIGGTGRGHTSPAAHGEVTAGASPSLR